MRVEPPFRTRPLRPVLFGEIASVFLVPLLFGLLETVQLLARTSGSRAAFSVGAALLQTIPRWLLYAPLAFAVRGLVRKFPLGSGANLRVLSAHAAAAILFSALHLAACVVVYGFLLDGGPNHVSFRMTRLVTVYFAADLLAYAAVASLWSASFHEKASRARALDASRLRASFEQARLDALRSQLQPHFLFNALNAAHVVARRGDAPAVASMLASLAEILRATFDESLPHEIPLSQDLASLERYLEIQRARFGDRVSVTCDISPEAMNALVPALVLQPIVENAFEHGVSVRPGPAAIRIAARRMENELRLEVCDNGPGFAAPSARPTRPGVGLANTRERLGILYGRGGSLETNDVNTGGARVVLVIPFRRANGSGPAALPSASRNPS